MGLMFKKATKEQAKLRLAVHGPSGSGKTYSGLSIAQHLVEPGKRIAVLDTERGSASKYADRFDFDVVEIVDNYHPDRCIEFLRDAAAAGYGAALIDSGTHFWNGSGGFLNLVDQAAKRGQSRGGKYDSFGAWKDVDPVYQALILAITSAPIDVIMTLRAKQAYEKSDDSNGRSKIQKLGLAPQMRDDFQYEFDIEGMMNLDHDLVIGKTRCEAVDGKVYHKPGKQFAETIRGWLSAGAVPTPKVERVETERQAEAPRENHEAPELDQEEASAAFVHLGARIEQADVKSDVDAAMKDVTEAYKAKAITSGEGKRLGAMAKSKVARFKAEAEAAERALAAQDTEAPAGDAAA